VGAMSFLPNTFDSVITDVSLMVEFLVSFSSIDIFTSIRLQQQDIKQKTKKRMQHVCIFYSNLLSLRQ